MSVCAPTILRECRAEAALHRALERMGADAGELLVHAIRPWASVTFSGTRHEFSFAFDGASSVARGEALLEALSGDEWAVPGHLVADSEITQIERRCRPPRLVIDFTVLLLEAC